MAILDEEDTPSRDPFAASDARLSALEGSAYALDTIDPAAGGEEAPLSSADVAYAQAAPQRTTARSPRIQARFDEINRLMEQRRAATGGDEVTRMRAITSNPEAMARHIAEAQEPFEMEPPPPPPKEEVGLGQIASRGLLRANEAVMQGKDIAEGKQPRESKTPRADYEDPLRIEDFASPTTAFKKLWLGLWQSYPAVAAGIAGSLAGGAAGSLAGPVGTTVGGIVGGAAGMGLGSGFMAIGPAYQAEYQALGENPSPEAIDEAWEKAKVTAFKEAGVGAASMALFGAGKPASNALKALLTPVVAGAEKPVAGVPLRAGVQLVGQPAISVGGQVTENVIEGKPLSTNLNEAAAGGIANVLPDVAAAAGARALRGRRGETTPGVSDDQNAALRAAQGEEYGPNQPLGPPMPPEMQPGPGGMPLPGTPVPPGRRYGTPEPPPPPPPPPGGPGGADLGGGPAGPGGAAGGPLPRPPPGGGPGGAELPPEMPTPGGIPPEAPIPPRGPPGPGPGGTPLPPESVPPIPPAPSRPPGVGPGGTPLPEERPVPPPITPVAPPAPPIGPGGTPLGPEPRPAGTTPERFEIGRPPRGEEPPPPPGGGGGGLPRPQPFAPTERPVGQRPTRPEDFTIERDHLDPARSVAKNETGEVVGKGATPEQATQDAALRQGAPYRDEGAGFTTERGSTYEIHDDGTTTRNKSYHPEHGPEDVGAKPRSAKTIYVGSQAEAANLSGAGVSGAYGHRLVLNPDGTATLAWKTAPDARWGTHANNRDIPFTTEPGVGKHPVEMWGKATDVPGAAEAYSGQHAGNKIVEMRGRPEEAPGTTGDVLGGRTEQVKPTAAGTKEQPVSERAPPAAAKSAPEPAAKVGGDAVPEPPKVETPAEQVKAKGEARQAKGTRTKSGAYVSPGEAAEPQAAAVPQAPRAARAPRTAMQEGAARESLRKNPKSSGAALAERGASERPAGDYPLTPDLETGRKARQVVRNILAGQPIADAIKAFGEKAPGSVGRPRNVTSLSSHIREELARTETPISYEAARNKVLNEAAAKLRKFPIGDERREPIVTKLTEDLNHLEDLQSRRPQLEKALADVEAAERGEKITGPKSMRIREMGRNIRAEATEYFSRQWAVNEPITRAVEQAGERGARLHDLLDALSSHDIANRLTPQMTELARVLRRVLPNSEVHDAAGRLEPNTAGLYEPGSGRIYLDLEHPTTAVNLLHEAIHAPTYDYVNHLYQTPEISLSPRELAHKTALNAIRNEVGRVLDEGRMSPAEYGELRYALNEAVDPSLNMAGPHEIATQLLTSPEVYDILSRTTASPEFRAALDRVGMGISSKASIWDGFKKIIRNIFGVPDRLDSVFDHVLRPLTEIVEEGSRFGRAREVAARQESIRHNNEVLGPAKLRDNASLQRLGRAARDVADRGIVKTVMRGAYQSATTTAIRDFIRNDVPSAVSHFEQLRKITHASEEERGRKVVTHGPNGEERVEPNINKARRLHKELIEGPDAIAVNKLMTDVTQAEMSVIDPRRNDHLTTQAELDVQRDLQDRFDRLDPAAKQTYREVNEYHNEIYRAEREAKVKSLVDLAFADRPEIEKQALREQMRTRQGVLDALNNPDATPVARALGQAWDNKKGLVKLIAESQEGGFVDGDYFPSRRHGEYIVSAGEHNKPGYMVQMFETQSQARAFRDELMRTRQDVSQVFVKSQSRPRDLVSVSALATLDRAMERAGLTGNAADVMRDMYAGVMIQQGTRLAARTMRREGIAGASVEQGRNILGDFLAYTSRIGHLMHGAEAGRTLYEAEKEARALHQAGSGASEQRVANAQLGVEELRRRMVPADGDNSADLMGRGTRGLTTLTVLNTLIRPAHFFMQLAGTHTAATSLIAARHGYLGSAAAVSRAFAQLSGTAVGAARRNAMAAMRQELQAANWNLADMYRARLKREGSGIAPEHADLLIDRLNQAGLINHTWIREIQRLAGPQGFGDHKFNVVSRFLDAAGAGEHALDSMMRVGTAKAAFEIDYRKNGGDLNKALDYAMEMAERSQPDYNMHNKPRIATVSGSLGRLAPFATQYRQFGLHMYGLQGNLLAEGVRGAKGSAERREAYKAIAYLQASHAVMWSGVGSAVFGSLPMMAGLGLYDLLNPTDPTRRAHTNRELENYSRNKVYDWTGSKTFADIFAHGIPFGLGFADVHRSLQFTNMLTPPELNSFNKPDVLSFLAQAITGASGDTAAGMVDGMGRIMDGDIKAETVAKMMPRIIRDPVEAIVWGQQGLKTGKGDLTIVPAEKFSTMDLAMKAAGFIPPIASTARDVRADVNLHELTRRDITGAIIDRFARAKTPAEQKAVREEVARYNNSVEPADRITGQAIQSRLREQAIINSRPELYGMRLPRKQVPSATELTRYARP